MLKAPFAANVASPDTLTLSNESEPSCTRICAEVGEEISESVAPARVEVVDKNDKFPEPSVPITWLAEPSAEGRVKVVDAANVSAAF